MTVASSRFLRKGGKAARSRRSRGSSMRNPAAWAALDRWVAAAFLGFCFLLGGTSQNLPMLYLSIELVSLVAIGFAIWRLTPQGWARARPFVIAALLLVSLPALQLIPLPAGLWEALPAHNFYAAALREIGVADAWRPATLSPDRTLRSLLFLLPVLAAGLLFAPLDKPGHLLLLDVLLVCLGASALLAVSQIAVQGPYFYSVTNRGSGVGFFSNRNHQALFVAIGIILIMARWRIAEIADRRVETGVIAASALVLFLPFLLIIGSRSGLLTGVLAFAAGGAVFLRRALIRQSALKRWAILAGVFVITAAALVLALLSSRINALDRLFNSDGSDLRAVNLPAVLDALWSFFPLGAGFGTFDPVFRRFEPYESLSPAYFNHAHNDLVEIVLEGGVFALALLGAILVLLARKAPILWIAASRYSGRILAKAGYLGLLLLGIGSAVDYPLRTPFLAVLAMLLAIWCFAATEGDDVGLGRTSRIG